MPRASTAIGSAVSTDEIAAVATELAQIEGAQRADLATLASAAETSEAAVAEAEAAALRAEAAHSAARQALDVARGPLAEAERRAQRLDTESKTLASFCTSTPRICGRR